MVYGCLWSSHKLLWIDDRPPKPFGLPSLDPCTLQLPSGWAPEMPCYWDSPRQICWSWAEKIPTSVSHAGKSLLTAIPQFFGRLNPRVLGTHWGSKPGRMVEFFQVNPAEPSISPSLDDLKRRTCLGKTDLCNRPKRISETPNDQAAQLGPSSAERYLGGASAHKTNDTNDMAVELMKIPSMTKLKICWPFLNFEQWWRIHWIHRPKNWHYQGAALEATSATKHR